MGTLLFVAANPAALHRLAQDEELRAIERQVREARYRDELHITVTGAARYQDLVQRLSRDTVDIVHVSGHCSRDGRLMFASNQDAPTAIEAALLGEVFARLKGATRTVVLTGCHTLVAARELVGRMDCVIAAAGNFDDRAAIAFSAAFYGELASSHSVRRAFDTARLLLAGTHRRDADHLCLLERRGGIADHIYVTGPRAARTRTRHRRLARTGRSLRRRACRALI